MKTKLTILGSLASLGAAASLNAQSAVTAAVGYHTVDLVGGFNLVGVNVGNPVAAAGQFDGAGAVDADVDFTALLTAGEPYTVQNIATGEVASVTSFTADTLTTDPPLATAADEAYEVRLDQTIDSLFGAANEVGLVEGNQETADRIWVPKGDGTYNIVYRNNVNQPFPPLSPGWRLIGEGDTEAGDLVVPFTAGIFVFRQTADPLSIVFVGHVRGDDPDQLDGRGAPQTTVDIVNGFNALNRIVPVDISIGESGLQSAMTAGNETTADILWNPKGDGTYDFVYNNDVNQPFPPLSPGLRRVGSGNEDAAGDTLQSGYLLQRKAAGGSTASIGIPPRLDL